MAPHDPSAPDASDPFHQVYDELHRLAQRARAKGPAGVSLQTTEILHEAWMKLMKVDASSFESEDHFLAVAASAMRSVLVDRARRKGATKRGGDRSRVDLDDMVAVLESRSSALTDLDDALQDLGAEDPELVRLVELRFFAGLKHPAIARILGVPLRRVERDWAVARAWLQHRLRSVGPT